jgi:DNA-directed RNA polymerase specialized sigma24 family protein
VPASVAEDLAHEALAIIVGRGIDQRVGVAGEVVRAATGAGQASLEDLPLASCFQVLRNAIGNYYQRRATRERWAVDGAGETEGGTPTPLELLEEREAVLRIELAIRRVESEDGDCGRYLRKVATGADPGAIANAEGIAPAVFYRRLYRCRARLREILEREGGVRT